MNDKFNLEERVLCEDDTCIGLVGPNGKCRVCGRVYQGDEALPPTGNVESAPFGDSTDTAGKVSDDDGEAAASEADTWDPAERVLCSDDTCVGIIGPDGTCGICGRPG